MKLKDATPEQITTLISLLPDATLNVNGIITCHKGEAFLQFEIRAEASQADALPVQRYSLYALPLPLLEEGEIDLYAIPRVLLALYPADVGSVGYPFRRDIKRHIAHEYAESEPESLFSIELDEIDMETFLSKGLGSYLLRWALRECRHDCYNKDRVITHIFGEIIPAEDGHVKDWQRFFRRHGFRRSGCHVYQMI